MRQWLKRRRVSLLILLCCYIMFCFFGGCADQFILFPNRSTQDPLGAARRTIPLANGQLEILTARSPGARLEGREPAAYVLSFTGNAGRAEWGCSDEALSFGFKSVEVWAPNHPGFGNSTGPAKLSRLAPAALAAYDALAAEASGKPIFISGTSLGCTMALHVAENRKAAGLILRTPPPLQHLIRKRHGWWNLYLLAIPVSFGVPKELNALRSAPKIKAPAVILLIDGDEVVPLSYQQKVADAYGGEKRMVLLKDGHHNSALSGTVGVQMNEGLEWLWKSAGLKP